jgi:transcriptional regulator with XRE-family HTH domain
LRVKEKILLCDKNFWYDSTCLERSVKMADAIDYGRLGKRLREVRKERELTLEEVSVVTGISIPTLSRVERGAAKGLQGETLLALSGWVGTSAKLWKRAGTVDSTPDVVELHLRADRNLDHKTADALAHLFRAAYEQLRRKQRE